MFGSASYIPDVRGGRKRRRFYSVLAIAAVVICLIILGADWLIFHSPFFRVEKIIIVGNKNVSEGEILDLLRSRILTGSHWRMFLGFNNLLVWPTKIFSEEGELIFSPDLKTLKIEKSYSTRSVLVTASERNAYGIWCAETSGIVLDSFGQPTLRNCYWFDDTGIIFRHAPGVAGGLIMAVHDYSQKNLGLYSKILPQEFIDNAFSVFAVVQKSGLNIKEIKLNDLSLEELEVSTYDGPTLYFSLRFPAANDLSVIQDFLSKPDFNKLQYLDFRVESRVYYK